MFDYMTGLTDGMLICSGITDEEATSGSSEMDGFRFCAFLISNGHQDDVQDILGHPDHMDFYKSLYDYEG
jgi:hypothetical protein